MKKIDKILNYLYNSFQEAMMLFGIVCLLMPLASSKSVQGLWLLMSLAVIFIKRRFQARV